ncbi:MAG: DNA polymerase III subunit beta [Bacilli bacterium]|nr:DNA polymerase III subunit beta [Bacilli bacterium]
MKLKIKRDLLLDNLNKVSKAISTKNLIPTLAGIKFDLTKEGLTLTASNNDITIQKTIIINDENMNIDEEGVIIIQGKDILDIVRIIPEEEINIEVIDESKVLIYTDDEKIKYDLNVINKNDYPNVDLEKNENHVVINSEDLLNIVKETAFATSTDESRAVLTGISFKINGDILECSATDSYRLAKKELRLNKPVEEIYNIIIPGKNLVEFSRIIDEKKSDIKLHIFNNKILFEQDNLLFQSRLISGNYPNTSKLIPEDSILKITANLSQLYNVIGQASILTTDKEKNIVSLSTNGDLLTVRSVANEKGKAEMKMTVKKDNNEDITIAFSAKYMMEALNALNTEEIELSFVGEVKPITIKNKKEDGLIQLVVPIRTY